MNKILLLFISLSAAFYANAFCDGFPTLTVAPQVCGENTITVTGTPGLFGCPTATSMYYQWSAITNNGVTIVLEEGTIEGSAPYFVDLEVSTVLSYSGVCLYMEVYNASGEIESTGSVCNYNLITLPSFDPSTSFDWTCDGTCFSLVYSNQAMFYYSYELDGQSIGISQLLGTTCLEPGTHTFSISGNGCTVSDTFEVLNASIDSNTSCESAIPLVDGVFTADAACTPSVVTAECSNWPMDAQNWFSFNSGNNIHADVAVTFEDIHVYGFQLWEETTPGNCNVLDLIKCTYLSEIPGCMLLTDSIQLTPNTNYYIQMLSEVGFEFEILIKLSNDEQSVCGCMDESSCMYNPDAVINTWNCGNAGCTDEIACNYQPWFTCDDGSCVYGTNYVAQLYHDLNGDGIWQSNAFAEPTLGNTGSIYVAELDATLFPNEDGQFFFPEIPAGSYTITYTDNSGLWNLTTGESYTLNFPTCNGAHIGLIPSSNTLVQLSGPCCVFSMDIHCVNGFSPGLWLQNTGTVPLNGTFVMTFNATLFAAQLPNAEPYDTYTPGVLTWNIVNQQPGELVLYQCHIQGPGASYVGLEFPFELQLELIDGNGNIAVAQDWLLEPTVVCSYDPNDKYCVPEGYADPHFILGTEELEYRIRFQNTGNSYAQNVVIEDQLDVEKLDMSTFYPVFASHDFSTILNGNGLVEFHFNNILLPDSATDEPGSQGYVVFRIKPMSGLVGGDEINNTASIYFDDNDPIITNTTWHTIFDCSWLGSLPESAEGCETYVTPDMTYPYAESYDWEIDGLSGGSNSPQETFTFEPGVHTVGVTISNPLCAVYSETTVNVNPAPQVEIEYNSFEGLLIVSGEYTFQWYLDGNSIEGATGNTLLAETLGSYTVLATNEWNCSFLSEPFVLLSDGNLAQQPFRVYPNPSQNSLQLDLPTGTFTIEIYTVLGDLVTNITGVNAQSVVDVSALAEGTYLLKATSNDRNLVTRFVVER